MDDDIEFIEEVETASDVVVALIKQGTTTFKLTLSLKEGQRLLEDHMAGRRVALKTGVGISMINLATADRVELTGQDKLTNEKLEGMEWPLLQTVARRR